MLGFSARILSFFVLCASCVWSGLVFAETAKALPAPPKLRGVVDKKKPVVRHLPVVRRQPVLRPVLPAKRVVPRKAVPRVVTPPNPTRLVTAPKAKKPFWEQHKHGLVLRGAALFLPDFFLNGLFFDESDGITNGGFALGYALKTSESFAFVFGVGYHFLNFIDEKDTSGAPVPHVFLNKGDKSYQREFVFNSLSYLSIDVRFLKTFALHKHFQLLVGGGVGLGIVFGSLIRTDTYIENYDSRKEQEYRKAYDIWKRNPRDPANALPNKVCQDPRIRDCELHAGLDETKKISSGNGRKENRVPPVIPIANFIFGFVFPIVPERWDIRLQGGLGVPRVFWAGMSTHIYF